MNTVITLTQRVSAAAEAAAIAALGANRNRLFKEARKTARGAIREVMESPLGQDALRAARDARRIMRTRVPAAIVSRDADALQTCLDEIDDLVWCLDAPVTRATSAAFHYGWRTTEDVVFRKIREILPKEVAAVSNNRTLSEILDLVVLGSREIWSLSKGLFWSAALRRDYFGRLPNLQGLAAKAAMAVSDGIGDEPIPEEPGYWKAYPSAWDALEACLKKPSLFKE